MAAMTQALDYPADEDGGTAYRERAKGMLNQIAQQARLALADQCIDLDLFFLAPNSGEAILIYGTPGNPDDASWERVGEIVAPILGRLIGLRGTRRQEVICATMHDEESHDAVA